jgi:chemotaxis protein CheD
MVDDMSGKTIVGMGEYKISSSNVMVTFLGSSVAVCLYDGKKKMGCLSHILVGKSGKPVVIPSRFADKAIPLMIKVMVGIGCSKSNIEAKIIGGASIFEGIPYVSGLGDENIKMARKSLTKEGIKIVAADTGGNFGRCVSFNPRNGKAIVSKMGGPKKEI